MLTAVEIVYCGFCRIRTKSLAERPTRASLMILMALMRVGSPSARNASINSVTHALRALPCMSSQDYRFRFHSAVANFSAAMRDPSASSAAPSSPGSSSTPYGAKAAAKPAARARAASE